MHGVPVRRPPSSARPLPMPTITIHSRRFGTLEVAASEIIEFPQGLIGLGSSRYVLVPAGEASPFSWLQSAENPELAVPVMDPWSFFEDFALELSDDTAAAAGLPA